MMKSVVLGLTALSTVASANVRVSTAPVLNKLEITQVASEARVLRERRHHPYTDFLVGVKVRVATNSACVKLAGQVNGGTKQLLEVTAIGASDAVNDACIAVMPMPIESVFTVDFPVLTGGIVASPRFVKKIVQFNGVGLHELELDTSDKTVTVKPVERRPR